MSNKVWDKISYNQSDEVSLDRAIKSWEDLTKERPIEEKTYHEITDKKAEIKKVGSDVY